MKSMKNIKSPLLILMALLSFSCSDVLNKEPLDELGDDAFWSDPVLIQYYVNDVYAELLIDSYMLNESRSDNSVTANKEKNKLSELRFNYNIETPTSTNDNIWNDHYEYIRKCNRFLEKIDNAPVEESTKLLQKGQIHFLRAMFYFDLVKRYGGVVLLDKVLTMNDNWNIPRSSEEECYNFILQDLNKAIEFLPASWDGKDKGRATKGAAWALKSRVELYTKQYDAVIKSCEEVYKLGYELVDGKTPENYRSIWWSTNKDNKEIIFDKQYKSPDVYNNIMIYHMITYINNPYGDRGWGGMGPTQELVDEFELKDGGQAPKFSDKSNTGTFDINSTKIYENREPRFYANLVCHGTQIFLKGDKGPVTVDRYLMDTPDKADGSPSGYNVWKWIDYDNYNYPYAGASGQDHSTNWIYIRYAEIFLNDAEARLETNDIQGALKAVNVIRARVGLPDITETNQAKLRELIRKERRLELAFEDHRFWDVRRWKIGDKTQKKLHGLRFTSPTEFRVDEIDSRVWDDRLYLNPIPHDEILRTNIQQNPGF